MALNQEKDESLAALQNSNKRHILDTEGNSGSNFDLESDRSKNKIGYGTSNKDAGARIAPVLPHLQGYDFGSDDNSSDILGKQIELEAENSIQYRTCSWQKVSNFCSSSFIVGVHMRAWYCAFLGSMSKRERGL